LIIVSIEDYLQRKHPLEDYVRHFALRISDGLKQFSTDSEILEYMNQYPRIKEQILERNPSLKNQFPEFFV
jgi:hypothetical protein